jgi:hypothetical protein
VPFLLYSPRNPEPVGFGGKYSTTSYRALITRYFDGGIGTVSDLKRILSGSRGTESSAD